MNDRYMKLKDAIDVVRNTVAEGKLESTLELRLLDKSLTADVVEVVRCKDCKHWHNNTEFCDQCRREAFIDAQLTADVRENVRGEWKEVVEPGLCDLRRCSNCGHIEAVGLEMITPKPNFCPNCGADMRGEP